MLSVCAIRLHTDEVAERLRQWTANPLCSAHVGSNPILIGLSEFYGVKHGDISMSASC